MLTEAPQHYQTWFTGDEFKARHERIYDAIGSDAVALVQGADMVEGFTIPRQTNEMMYLTGCEVQSVYLLLDGRDRTSTIYLPDRDEKHAASEGAEVTAQDVALVQKLTGCDQVKSNEDLLPALRWVTVLYTPHAGAEGSMVCQDTVRFHAAMQNRDAWTNHQSREACFMQLLRSRVANLEIRDLSPTLNTMRMIKSAAEIELMRCTGELTATAVVESMKITQAGMVEGEFGALADYLYQISGGRGHGFRPIIASGERIWQIHYYRNNCEIQDGELLLMDTGAEVCNYTSDIGRIWPVNGTYDATQRQLYGFMVELHKALLSHIVAGATSDEVMAAAKADMEPLFASTKWIKPTYQAAARRVLDESPTRHLTHTVGMAVHDTGVYYGKPMEPGLVFALDPQLWVPEEEIYLRVEDTVVVTEDGVEILTGAAPLELDEVEALVGSDL